MIGALLQPPVEVRECLIVEATGVLLPDEEDAVRSAVPKRRREFLAGRSCARAALRALGLDEAPLPVRADRTPAWPADVVGSITHSDIYCAAAVAWRSDVAALGIDVEDVARFDLDLLPVICTPRERAELAARPAAERRLAAALVFSAKEAFYKCQYTLTGSWLGFQDVEVDLHGAPPGFRITVVADAPALPARSFEGRCAAGETIVAAAIAFPRRAGLRGDRSLHDRQNPG